MLIMAYELDFKEKPDYERLKFMFRKILMDRDYLPDRKFDWSLRQGQNFKKVSPNSRHSSISSCDLSSEDDAVDYSAVFSLR